MTVPPQRWIYLADWADYWTFPTERGLRWMEENPDSIFRECFKRVDGRIVVDHVKFWQIMEEA